jgi:methylmalonyl-CoA mutase
VNDYISSELYTNILDVDNSTVRNIQLQRLADVKRSRNESEVRIALDQITKCARDGSGNLLELSIRAARNRATLGEISQACEKVFGRYEKNIQALTGVYLKAMKDDVRIKNVLKLSHQFAKREGRRPRILIAKLGQDGHDRGARVVAAGLADLGFDVDISPLFTMPEEVAKQAIENDVHIIGISTLAGGHKTLIPQLMRALQLRGRGDILVAAGGIIPEQDISLLRASGVVSIFIPGTPVVNAAEEILKKISEKK